MSALVRLRGMRELIEITTNADRALFPIGGNAVPFRVGHCSSDSKQITNRQATPL